MWVYWSLLIIVTFLVKLFYKPERNSIKVNTGLKKIVFHSSGMAFIIAFVILAVFSAVRDGIGVDYEGYYQHIRLIQRGTPHYMEIGFKELVNFVARFSDNPRWIMIIMSVLTCYCYLKVFWKYSPNPAFSVFLFLSWGYYFFTFNTVRGYFAQSVALIGLLFLIEKKYIKFIVCIIIASLFHKTALVCIPLYILSQKEFKSKYKYAFVIIFAIGAALVFKPYLRSFIFSFYPEYLGSAYDTESVSWLNILKALIVVAIAIFYYPKVRENRVNQICFNLNIFSLIFYMGFYWVPEISRIGFYMNTTAVFLIPRLLSGGEYNQQNKTIIKMAFIAGSLVLFFLLMRGFYNSTIQLLPYKTWLGGEF